MGIYITRKYTAKNYISMYVIGYRLVWCNGAMMLRHKTAKAQRCKGTKVQRHKALKVQRCKYAKVQRHKGAKV